MRAFPNRNHGPERVDPMQHTLEILAGKWSLEILKTLLIGDRRPHELLAVLPGISTKTLIHRLRSLEQRGIVERRLYAEVPPRVEYALTPKGREIQVVLRALDQVGQRWLQQEQSPSDR